jgi:uncharacterized lipoprotein YmbA
MALLTCLIIGSLAGCSSTPDPNFFILQATQNHSVQSLAKQDDVIIVGPVILPEHLSRREMISRSEDYRVSVAEFDRWAEPLDSSIALVVTDNLSTIFSSEQVLDYYARLAVPADYAVRIRVLEFGRLEGSVQLLAVWSIHNQSGDKIALRKIRYAQAFAASEDKTTQVEAMSTLLGQMSLDIAKAISSAKPAD